MHDRAAVSGSGDRRGSDGGRHRPVPAEDEEEALRHAHLGFYGGRSVTWVGNNTGCRLLCAELPYIYREVKKSSFPIKVIFGVDSAEDTRRLPMTGSLLNSSPMKKYYQTPIILAYIQQLLIATRIRGDCCLAPHSILRISILVSLFFLTPYLRITWRVIIILLAFVFFPFFQESFGCCFFRIFKSVTFFRQRKMPVGNVSVIAWTARCQDLITGPNA